ncbi:unnamed protein product [Lymnaea stagnalis]|uniref:Uncharacterized protein n=1 Tax=Lymnaea stagnalis TaxID=6523 RepID=A0AAV2IIU1_LYMST
MTCNEACNHKTWGEDCGLTCSQFCNVDESLFPEVCHHVTGTCLLGCVSGHSGATCETDNSKVIGLASGLGTALALAVSLLILIYYLKRQQATGVPNTSPGQMRLQIDLNLGSGHTSCGTASPVQTCAPLPTQRTTPGSGTQPSAGQDGTNNGHRNGSDSRQEPIYAIPNNRSVSVEGVTQTVHQA